ncbi:MAG TPA: methyltransferase domain-containing protein [Acidimicrobiales bacterium]|nr:methyltransferase domain-containing protein [Acidimicrobiales bacterium]
MAGRYDFPYTDDSTYARAVRMVEAHAPAGVVVDLGCGRGRPAGPLTAAGYGYVGLDADADAVAAVRADGFEAAPLDLADAGGLGATLDAAVADRPVEAVLLLDCIEHLADPDATLDALARWCAAHGDPLVVLSVPNVAHVDLGIKLLSGFWDRTEAGLIDATHLSWFTERRVVADFGGRGWAEVARDDVVIPRSEQEAPTGHPFWGPYSTVEAALRWLRRCADGTGDTYQFVRAFRRHETSPPSDVAAPALSAVVRAGGPTLAAGDQGLEDLLTCLAAQDLDGTEVVVATTADAVDTVQALVDAFAEPLRSAARVVVSADASDGGVAAAGLAAATGTMVAFLEPGQLLTADWARRFVEGAAAHPGRLVRVQGYQRATTPGPGGAPMTLTRATPAAPGGYNPAAQFRRNQLPLGTYALPRSLCRPGAVWWEPRPGPEADWAFATLAAMAAGVVDLPDRTVISAWSAEAGRWAPHLDSPGALSEGLMPAPVLMHVGAAGALIYEFTRDDPGNPAHTATVAALVEQVDMLQRQSGDLYAELERLRAELAAAETARDAAAAAEVAVRASTSWRVTAPLRGAVGVSRRVRRLGRRP